jgi:hypothetical protein
MDSGIPASLLESSHVDSGFRRAGIPRAFARARGRRDCHFGNSSSSSWTKNRFPIYDEMSRQPQGCCEGDVKTRPPSGSQRSDVAAPIRRVLGESIIIRG